jgi:hypothetical protein
MIRKIRAHNLEFEKEVSDLEAVIQIMKIEKKTILRAHKADMRAREKREIRFVVLVATCIMMYVVFALMTRGFV